MPDTEVQPDPAVWPKCPTCDVAWVLRRGMSISEGWKWVWQRDCKHKTVTPVIARRDDAE
jgi:hypothetical protein